MSKNASKKTNLARPWIRFLAFTGDLGLAHLLSFFLLSFPTIAFFEDRLIESIKPIALALGFSPELVGFLIFWHLMTMILRFIHTFIFGVSFFEHLAGLTSTGPWWWQRLGGGARVMIDSVMGPFLVFDLPLLFNKVTLKEDLIGSKLVYRGRKKDWRLYFFLPLTILFSFSGPLFKDLTLIDGLIVSFENIEKEGLKAGDDFSKFTSYGSEKFKLKTFSSLDNGRFSLFPDFEFVKVKKKKRLSPYLLIYDHANKTTGELKVGLKIYLLDLLKRGERGNPFFRKSFPALHQAIHSERAGFAEKPFSTFNENRSLMNPMIKDDIKNLIKASFELGMGNIVGHILTYGPFLRGFIEVRNALISLSKPGVHPEVDMITMGNMDFLSFRQTFSDDIPFNKQVVSTYIPIGTHNSFTLEMGWDKSLPGALSSKGFRESFLANGEWFFDYYDFFKRPRLEAEVTPFYAIDLLANQSFEQPTQEILEEFLYRYYYQKCRKAIQSEDKAMIEGLRYNIIRLSSIIKVKNEGKKKNFSALFLNQWKELWSSFQAQDKNYFNI
ncbi:MAG: hypothetical protein K9K67_12385 [Bacteriovoracaceae bacterium]|nr:hypothetical protein [Bacteriovoracaceae bacterium]